ncbi:hypothetical protein M0R45_009092 [Rubus argutus]|uniref:Uncharacterized protein n=1 Tax=Rubus argutus TaxID=59490 RepID=A0AAW1Y615_RUBAR
MKVMATATLPQSPCPQSATPKPNSQSQPPQSPLHLQTHQTQQSNSNLVASLNRPAINSTRCCLQAVDSSPTTAGSRRERPRSGLKEKKKRREKESGKKKSPVPPPITIAAPGPCSSTSAPPLPPCRAPQSCCCHRRCPACYRAHITVAALL